MFYAWFYFSLHGSVNLALGNAFGIYIASKFFSVIKTWVLQRHSAHSVPIS